MKLKDKIAIVTGASQGIGKGIAFQVNALSPGPILASLQQRAYPSEKLLDSRNRAVLMNRHGTPEEIARVVILLNRISHKYLRKCLEGQLFRSRS